MKNVVLKHECKKCSRLISPPNVERHRKSCKGPKKKKIKGIDFDPNWGYGAGIRVAWNKGKKTGIVTYKIPDDELFSEKSSSTRAVVRKRVLKDGILPYVCALCKNPGTWCEQPLSLHLDHINGIWNDHRLENLRFLCPNCHSQTKTYAGKRKKYKSV